LIVKELGGGSHGASGTMVTVGVLLPARAPPEVGDELKNVLWLEQ
jgi:hypothetical protein